MCGAGRSGCTARSRMETPARGERLQEQPRGPKAAAAASSPVPCRVESESRRRGSSSDGGCRAGQGWRGSVHTAELGPTSTLAPTLCPAGTVSRSSMMPERRRLVPSCAAKEALAMETGLVAIRRTLTTKQTPSEPRMALIAPDQRRALSIWRRADVDGNG